MKTPEQSMKVPWVGKDRCHASSKFISVTQWEISDLHGTPSSSLHVVSISMSMWFSRGWFGLGFLCSCVVGGELEKRQTKSCTKDTKKWKDNVSQWEKTLKRLHLYFQTPAQGLVLKNWKAPPASQLKATSQSLQAVSKSQNPSGPLHFFCGWWIRFECKILYNFPYEILAC